MSPAQGRQSDDLREPDRRQSRQRTCESVVVAAIEAKKTWKLQLAARHFYETATPEAQRQRQSTPLTHGSSTLEGQNLIAGSSRRSW